MEEEKKTSGFKEFEEEIVKEHAPTDPLAQLLIHNAICQLQFGIAFGRERRGLPVATSKSTPDTQEPS